MKTNIPDPNAGETPSSYADRLGLWYSATVPVQHKKLYGQYFTPKPVAAYMAHLLKIENGVLSLLDPGAGTGILTCSVGETIAGWKTKPSRMNVVAYETDSSLADLPQLSQLRE